MTKNDFKGRDVLIAMVLLTRIPLPTLPPQAFERQSNSAWSFPLVGGLIVLPLCVLASLLMTLGFSAEITAGLILAHQMLLTGAMHEDGLADTADGFWGGFTKERRLEIMKDSQIGSYGVLALVLCVGLRWLSYAAILQTLGVWGLIPVAILSRAAMPFLMWHLPHARTSGLSQSVGRVDGKYCIAAILLSGAISGMFLPLTTVLAAAGAVSLVTLGLGALAKRKIGGQTGDVLGASQQIAEIAVLLTLLP